MISKDEIKKIAIESAMRNEEYLKKLSKKVIYELEDSIKIKAMDGEFSCCINDFISYLNNRCDVHPKTNDIKKIYELIKKELNDQGYLVSDYSARTIPYENDPMISFSISWEE